MQKVIMLPVNTPTVYHYVQTGTPSLPMAVVAVLADSWEEVRDYNAGGEYYKVDRPVVTVTAILTDKLEAPTYEFHLNLNEEQTTFLKAVFDGYYMSGIVHDAFEQMRNIASGDKAPFMGKEKNINGLLVYAADVDELEAEIDGESISGGWGMLAYYAAKSNQ